MAQELSGPMDNTIASYDDFSWSIPKFSRYEEFEPGPFQKGFTPLAYEQTGWEMREEDTFDDLPMWWADDSTLVDTVQWFDQVPFKQRLLSYACAINRFLSLVAATVQKPRVSARVGRQR